MKNKPTSSSGITELRRQAEAKLGERKKKTAPLPTMDSDIRRLVHELQVHQIELEMQNEELLQTRAELEAALYQYTDLYDFAPIGYFTLARDGVILQVNLAGANLLGLERGTLIKRRFEVFVAYQFRTTFDAFLEKVFASGNKEACEIALQKEGPDSLWARIEAATDASRGQGEACRAVMMDISERVQAEEQLRYLGSHDALTGLYNRGFFMEEMARLERGRQFPISIIMADMDHLKDTNDRHGHAAGDALLKRIAQALTAAFRAEDVVARIGGDEFAVLLPATGWLDAEILLKRVYLEIQKDNAAHTETPIRLSIGSSTARSNAPLLGTLKEADENMYRKKREQNAS